MKPWHEMNEDEMLRHSANLKRQIVKATPASRANRQMEKTEEALRHLGAGKPYGEK